MKKCVKITAIVICSLIIVLACVGAVFSILNAINYSEIIDSHNGDDAWLATEECSYCKLRKDVHEVQFFNALGVVFVR